MTFIIYCIDCQQYPFYHPYFIFSADTSHRLRVFIPKSTGTEREIVAMISFAFTVNNFRSHSTIPATLRMVKKTGKKV